MANNEKIIADLKGVLGDGSVQTDKETLSHADGAIQRRFERAFGYVQEKLPVCVAKAHSTQDVSAILKYCNDNKVDVIAKTGASSSEDNFLVINDHTIFLDASEMNRLYSLDEENMMATVGCGMPLCKLEDLANAKGLTTGHCPQSQPMAFMGGLAATRSIGQFSTYYGCIEDMVCGLEAVMPNGEIVRIRNIPRSSTGPDLRHLFIGSEGALAVITELTVKLYKYYPEHFWKGAFVVESFVEGIDTIREILTTGFRPSVVRLYDKPDMDENYGSVELKDNEACMFFVAEGPPDIARVTGENIAKIAAKHNAKPIDVKVVDHWLATRNNICNTIGTEVEREEYRQTRSFYATCEISASWTDIKKIYESVLDVLPKKIDNLVYVGGHVSHSYQNGTNVYFVYRIKATDPLLMTSRDHWKIIDVICTEVLKQPTGSIAHHHGIGKVRVKRIKDELGTSYPLLQSIKSMMDPNGIMNPGTLIPLD